MSLWSCPSHGLVGPGPCCSKAGLAQIRGPEFIPIERRPVECDWTFNDGQYIGSCDPDKFINIAPFGMKFCPYCGRKLSAKSFEFDGGGEHG